MGLFTDRCDALIDPATGRALSGEALKEAQLDRKWPRCGYAASKKARFCSKCGKGAPGGWWKCPSCNKWVGNESNFCPHCKAELNVDSRELIASGRWQKQAGQFAARFEVGDLRRLLERGLVIETGTAGILLDGGRYRDVLGPGRHNLESLARRINNWGSPPPRTVILVEAGDAVLPLRIEGLLSAEEIPLELYTEVCLRFREKGAEDFVANLFKERDRMGYEDLSDVLKGDIRHAVENMTNTTTIEDLVKDPARRLRLEDSLAEALKRALDRYGLEIVRLAAVDFVSEKYEKLREQAGDLEVKRRELEFGQRLRELTAGDKMQAFKTEQDLDEYVRQMAHERGITDTHREHETARLKQVQRHELTGDEAAWQMAREMERTAHEIGVKLHWDDYTRDKLLKDAQLQDQIKRIEIHREQDETKGWLDVKAQKLKLKREDMAETAKVLEGKDLSTLIALIDDPAKREDLMALQKQAALKGMSGEQILMAGAAESPELARILLEKERSANQDREQEWAERKRMQEDAADRLERIMKEALRTTAEAAKNPGSGGTNIVK